MSVATSMNLAISVVEETPAVGREIYRGLTLEEMKGLVPVVSRLNCAIERRIERDLAKELLSILRSSMVIHGTEEYLQGVAAVESLIDSRIRYARECIGEDTEMRLLEV